MISKSKDITLICFIQKYSILQQIYISEMCIEIKMYFYSNIRIRLKLNPMKYRALLIFISLQMHYFANSQSIENYTIDIQTLIDQTLYGVKEIRPVYENGFMAYVNIEGKKIFTKSFDLAYPFFEKSALVQQDGKYGIIDLQGNYIASPTYTSYELPPYDNESYIIIFTPEIQYDLRTGELNKNGYTVCEMPEIPELYAFKDKSKKYGVMRGDKIVITTQFDTVYSVNNTFSIASKKGKIGVVTPENKLLVDFEYNHVSLSKETEYEYTYPIFGLEKNGKWIYFENGIKLIESNYKVNSFMIRQKNAIGIYKEEGKENILFKNGETLKNSYDWIDGFGVVAIDNKKIYVLDENGKRTLFYVEN